VKNVVGLLKCIGFATCLLLVTGFFSSTASAAEINLQEQQRTKPKHSESEKTRRKKCLIGA
jgi:hypothetical protein